MYNLNKKPKSTKVTITKINGEVVTFYKVNEIYSNNDLLGIKYIGDKGEQYGNVFEFKDIKHIELTQEWEV